MKKNRDYALENVKGKEKFVELQTTCQREVYVEAHVKERKMLMA